MKAEKYQDAMLLAREKMQRVQDEKAKEHQEKEGEVCVREGGKVCVVGGWALARICGKGTITKKMPGGGVFGGSGKGE